MTEWLPAVGESRRYPSDVAAGLPIPSAAKDFLTTVGLPVETEYFMAAEQPEVTTGGQVRVGTDFGTDICVDAAGQVRSIDAAGEYPERFINSDVSAFARSLAVVTAGVSEWAGRPDDEIDEQVEVLAAALEDIDKAVFADPENWWSVIFEQLRDGLL